MTGVKIRRQISLQSQIVGCVLISDVVEEFGYCIPCFCDALYCRVGALIHESVGEGLHCRLSVILTESMCLFGRGVIEDNPR